MTGAPTVLVVDDDASVREVVQGGLAGEGYRVLTAANGQAALDVLHTESVDLILLDMNMPVMDGWTFARTYRRQQPPWVPVVAFTAAQDAVQAAAAIGAGGHLNKPFELADLLSTVEQNCHALQWPTDHGVPAATLDRGLFLAALVSSSDDAIIGKTLDGQVTEWNAAAEVLYGYTAAEMIGEPIARLIPSDCAGELPVIMERIRRGERIPPFETVRRRKDGWRLDVLVTISPVIDATGRILGAATIARDITAAKQLIAQLHALAYISEMLDHAHPDPDTVLESITNHVSQVLGDGAVLRLANGGVLELVAAHHRNAVARAVLLQSLEESVVEGRGLEGQVALSKLPLRISQLVSDESGPAATTTSGVELRHYVDRVGLASLLVVPVRLGDRSLGTLMVLRDRAGRPYTEADQTFLQMLAERLAVALENARLFASERQARAHAEHAVELLEQSVGLRDQVLLTVSHDMRNPLMAIMGHAQVLDLTAAQSGALADSPLRRGLERIMKAARAVNGDLDELVDASRLQLGEPLVLLRAPTDLVALAVQTIDTWRVSTPGHRFEFAPREVALVGMWDRRRLARVLDNLLANAAKYSPAGSLISIRLCSVHRAAGQMAVLEVQDEGIGIDATDVPHIFTWFRRGRNVAHIDGTGIGLASAAGVIAQHGGSLRVESQQGHGSTFVLELPLLARSVDPRRQPRRAMDGPEIGQ